MSQVTSPYGDVEVIESDLVTSPYGDVEVAENNMPVGTEHGGTWEAIKTIANPLPVAAKALSGYAALPVLVAEQFGLADEGAAVKLIEKFQEAATFEPKTQIGKNKVDAFLSHPMMQFIGNAINQLNVEVKGFGDDITGATGSPMLATAVTSPMLAMPEALEATGAGATLKALQLGGRIGKQKIPQGAAKQEIGRKLAAGEPHIDTIGHRLKSYDGLEDVPQWQENTLDALEYSPSDTLAIEPPPKPAQPELTSKQLKIEKYPESKRLIEQGFMEGDVASISSSTPENAAIMTKMADQKKRQIENTEVMTRPSKLLGDAFAARVKAIKRAQNVAGKKLNKSVRELDGKDLPYNKVVNDFLARLADKKITLSNEGGKVSADLSLSKFMNDSATQALLDNVFERVSQIANRDGTMAANGRDLHELKQLIDNSVSWGKGSSSRLTSDGESLVKGLRGEINKLLQDNSPSYKAANKQYATAIGALKELDDATGSKIDVLGDDFDPVKIGLESRKLMSNYNSAPDLDAAFKTIEGASKHFGYDDKLNMPKLALFSSILDTRFGKISTARESFGGNLEAANRIGQKDTHTGLIDLGIMAAKKGHDKYKNINDKQAMEDLLKLLRGRSK